MTYHLLIIYLHDGYDLMIPEILWRVKNGWGGFMSRKSTCTMYCAYIIRFCTMLMLDFLCLHFFVIYVYISRLFHPNGIMDVREMQFLCVCPVHAAELMINHLT